MFCDGLNRIPGVRCARPGGAFYAFANITETGMDSKTAADFLLNEAGAACLSGRAFGNYGEGYIRVQLRQFLRKPDGSGEADRVRSGHGLGPLRPRGFSFSDQSREMEIARKVVTYCTATVFGCWPFRI